MELDFWDGLGGNGSKGVSEQGHTEMGPRFKFSSKRPEKLEISLNGGEGECLITK